MEEKDHMVLGCPETGPIDLGAFFAEAWGVACQRTGLDVATPGAGVFERYRFQLAAALIPRAASVEGGCPPWPLCSFCLRCISAWLRR